MTDTAEKKESGPSLLYQQAGRRIKERRKALNISQTKMAEMLDISYQQVQKYENGLNQLSLGRLLQFASALNVPPDYFYEGITIDAGIGESIESDVISRNRTRPLGIMLIEDSPADALLFERALQPYREDVALKCVSDTEKVMEHLKNETSQGDHTDIIILDLNLPKINGVDLLKSLKSNSQTAQIPVIIFTNSISRREMAECYSLGCSGFVQKSFEFEDYKASVDSIIKYWLRTAALPL